MPYLFFTLFISVIVAVFAVQNAVSVIYGDADDWSRI